MTQFTKMWNGLLLPRSCANSPPVPPLSYSSQEWDSTSGIAATLGSIALSRRLTLEEKKTGAAIVHSRGWQRGSGFLMRFSFTIVRW